MGNLEIREFQQTIIAFANQSQLPIEVKRMAMSEIVSQLNEASNEQIKRELQERENAKKEESEE